MVKINGENVICEQKSIAEFLKSSDYNITHIAIELNGEIIPKSQYDFTVIHDGDEMEIVSFVGGG